MTDADACKYRAFLSYSHADSGVAQRVHRRLESFRIDNDLVGRVTPTGPIPKTLRPIFRDRNDFDAGASLGEQTSAALDDSAALILLASPHSARSKYADEEVRLFKSRHPDRPLIPLIVEGTPGDAENECFVPALRFAVAPDGAITERPLDVLAADLRETGDGFELALAKVVARLIGLAPDDVYRRAERERRRQSRLRMAVGAVIAALAIAGGGLFWQSYQQKETLAEVSALVDKYSPVTPAQGAVPGAKQSLTAAITAIAEGAATDPRYAQALALLKAGKPAEAEPLLKAVAEDKAKRADKDAKDAAAAYRNLASIAAVSDPGRARDYYALAARLDPSDMWGMYQNGWFQQDAGKLDAAQAAYARVIAAAKPGSDDEALLWAQFGTGAIELQRGDLGAALVTYRKAQALAQRLAQSDPDNAGWQRDLLASYDCVGDVLVAQGNLPDALKSFHDGLAIADRLAQSDPGNAGWQRNLSVSDNKIGDVLVAQGNLPDALKSFRDGHAIADRLTKAEPDNAGWQRDLSFSDNKVGDVLVALGKLPDALQSFHDGLAIRDRLAKADPGNAGWQRDLSVSYERVGGVLAAQGNLPDALQSFRDGLAIRDRLAKADPGNAGWQRDLSVSYDRVGDMLVAHRNLPEALKSYRDGFAIADRLAKADPGNTEWQRDVSVSDNKIGDVLKAQGNLPEALQSYRDAFAIADRLAKADPGNAGWQRDVSVSDTKIGDVLVAQGNLPDALQSYRDGLAIAERLAQSDPGNAGWLRDLIISYAKTAAIDRSQAEVMLTRAAEIAKDMQSRGILAPRDAWMPGDLARRIAALKQ